MKHLAPLLLALSGVLACAPESLPASTAARSGPALAPASTKPIPFIEDDYARALTLAKKSGRPLFVDAWAPWCHTCLSMRAYVFTDPAMRAHADDFVWLAVDTEKPDNASFVEAFPMEAWPTLWVVDAKTGKPGLKWLGSATAPELASLLEDAKLAIVRGDKGGEAAAALVRGNKASAEARREDAAREYRTALSLAAPDWPRRARVVEALAARLSELKEWDSCVEIATVEVPRLPPGTSLANVALSGLECAKEAPEGSAARAQLDRMAKATERLAIDRSLPILADDRSGLFEALVEHYTAAGRRTDARVIAIRWAEFLEAEAARAPNATAGAVFDAHRVLAYSALGDPARALPMLAQSERNFPGDYNPPARIARVYLDLKRYDEALAAVDRAIARGYGPRKLVLYRLRADTLQGKGDESGLVATLREAVAYGHALPAGEQPAKILSELEKRLSDAAR
jgi:thiol-disulfide isomerase/thioredoxin